jgi:hypothetical protein
LANLSGLVNCPRSDVAHSVGADEYAVDSDTLENSVKIVSVRSYLLSYPLPEPLTLTYYGGERTIVKRDAMVIRIESASGLVGYGPGEGSEKAPISVEPRSEERSQNRWAALRSDEIQNKAKFVKKIRPPA